MNLRTCICNIQYVYYMHKDTNMYHILYSPCLSRIYLNFSCGIGKKKKRYLFNPPRVLMFHWHLPFRHKHSHAHAYVCTNRYTDKHNHILFFFFRLDNWCIWGASWPAGAGERGYGGAISHLLSHTQTLTLECTHTWSQKNALLTCTLQTIWVHVQVCYQGCAVCNAGSDLGTKTIEG